MHFEELGDESAMLLEALGRSGQGSLQELGLEVLIDLVKSREVGSSVAHYEVCWFIFEHLEDSIHGLFGCDVSLKYFDSVNRFHLLQVHGDNSNIVIFFRGFGFSLIFVQLLAQDLGPTAWRGTEVNCSLDSFKDVKFLVNL